MIADDLLGAAGSLQRAYEDVDWPATPVGPMETWSPALRSAVDLALHTQFPVTLFWGPEFVLIYNEAYVPLIADKHPAALGAPARTVFPEAWEFIGPMMRGVLAGEGATWSEDAYVPLRRRGMLEEAYFTFSYSPVRSADGHIEGVIDIATETTRRVIDRRRLEQLDHLRELLFSLDRVEDVLAQAPPLLRANERDFPDVAIAWAAVESAGVADGSARLPLGSSRVDGRVPVLDVTLSEQLPHDETYLGFLRLIASSLGDAIDRIEAREAERAFSETLQRSLLPQPPQRNRVQVAVRYFPAAEQARIGGDWYDSFVGAGGALKLVVGDVTGHDQQAAVAMAQVRNLLRGVCFTTGASPAGVLTALDRAMHGLALGVFATVILAKLEQGPTEEDERGPRTLQWSSAGHPPPVLLTPDGSARLLETRPDTLLGLGREDDPRADHTVVLAPGASVVFFTDGLVEHRRIPIDARLEWLRQRLADRQDLTAEQICDHLLAQVDGPLEDDVALLVLRLYPEDEPRPADAGAEILPSDLR